MHLIRHRQVAFAALNNALMLHLHLHTYENNIVQTAYAS